GKFAAEEVRGVHITKNEIGIGNGWLCAATVIARRTGVRARRLRPHFHRAAQLINPDDTTAATADRLNVELRHEKGVLVDNGFRRGERPAIANDADVEAGAADVRSDDVSVAEGIGQKL